MAETIWDEPWLPVKLSEHAAIQGDREGRVTLWVLGRGTTLTNEETAALLRLLCPTQAQTDADYDQMFRSLEDQAVSLRSMSNSWSNLCRYWHSRALGTPDEDP